MYNNRSGGGRNRFRDRDSKPRTMFQAVCAECGDPCEVPFRPSGNRPVYCNKHFKGREGGDFRKSDNRSFDRPRYGDSRRSSGGEDGGQANAQILGELKNLNMKMDKLVSLLEIKSVKIKPTKSPKVKEVTIKQHTDQASAEG